MNRLAPVFFLTFLAVAAPLAMPAAADKQADETVRRNKFGARVDTAAYPPARRNKPYKPGQRVVYTIWVDNDDPYDGMRDVVLRSPDILPGYRIDLDTRQSPYGNVFYDSRIPELVDTPARCRLYYLARGSGDTRQLTFQTPPSAVASVYWVCTRGNSEQVVAPHDGNENIHNRERADVRYGVSIDRDEMYVRFAVIVEEPPQKKKK